MKNPPQLSGKTALVVGGGLIGLCAALNLQQAGAAVTVIEPQRHPRGASWGNAGHIATEQVQPLASPATIRSVWSRLYPRGPLALPGSQVATWAPFAARLVRSSTAARFAAGTAALSSLLASAMPAWRSICAQIGASHLLIEDGHFVAWESPETVARGRAFWMAADIGTASVRDATTHELGAIRDLARAATISGAIRFAGSGQISDLGALADALRECLVSRSGAIRHVAADALFIEQGSAVLRCRDEILGADHVVLCAGAASAELLRPAGIHIPLIAERGYHVQSADSRWPRDMPPVAFEDRSMIVTRFAGGLRAAGFVEFAARATPPDPAKWHELRRHVAELGLPFDLPGEAWMGARPTLPDYLPAIGRSRQAPNLLYAFGHQHLGMTLAAITGELVAAMATGNAPMIDLAPFDPARFGGTP